MRLNVLTGAFVIFTILLCFALGIQLASRPKPGGPPSVKKTYIVRTAAIMGGLVVGITGCFVCSIVVLRRAREEYRKQAVNNMEDLIKSTLASHKKQDDA